MKKAAIDIGTNSTRLFIAEVKKKQITEPIFRETEITRLGEGVNAAKKLKKSAINRTLKVLKNYRSIIDSQGVTNVKAVATSAVRDAANSTLFLEKVSNECGLDVDILDGRGEAELSFFGATADPKLRKKIDYFLVIDIGGGSTELIFGTHAKIDNLSSMDAGCVRLTEMFLKDDPPSVDQIKELRSYLRLKLAELFPDKIPLNKVPEELTALAVAGTSTSLVAIDMGLEPYNPKIVHGALFSRERTEYILLKLAKLNLEKLRKLKGLEPKRADVIIAGAAIQAEIMDYFGLDKVRVSEMDILDGIILKS